MNDNEMHISAGFLTAFVRLIKQTECAHTGTVLRPGLYCVLELSELRDKKRLWNWYTDIHELESVFLKL